MNAAHSLELALFRQQRSQIRRSLVAPSRAFQAYEKRYLARTRAVRRILSRTEVSSAVRNADVTYVGDYHTLREAQQAYVALVDATRRADASRPLVMALEFIEGRHQATLDAYLSGMLTEDALREALGHPLRGERSLWRGFLPVLRYAKEHGVEVLGIDRRATGKRSLELRDAYAGRRIAQVLRRPTPPRVLVLIGQYHVVPSHLPAQVRSQLGKRTLQELVIYQSCEGVYWSLARQKLHRETEAVEIRPGELCLMTASPVLCQQSFLDYLEAEAGEAALDELAGPEARFLELASLVAQFVGVDVRDALDETRVLTAKDLDAMDTLATRGKMTRQERKLLREQVLSRHSYYIPRANAAYLASTSLSHIAEEATHFVRHCCVGEAMDAPRAPEDAFYARCLEEALGFFGSRLVHPARTCPSLDEWAKVFRSSRKAVEKHVAAFVLAHKAAELGGRNEARKLVPLRPDRLFNGVTHGLGYLLGERLHQAFEDGRLSREDIRALFRNPFHVPADTYYSLLEDALPVPETKRPHRPGAASR